MNDFLPASAREMHARGWDAPDFVYAIGDAYVDHPSFGAAIISRVLEREGYRVAMLPQPAFRDCAAFTAFGRPRLGFLVSAGVVDSMVNHYTAAKKRRRSDVYSPGGSAGLRPDRATIAYCNRIREAYGDVPILIGGMEASLRRFAHYDYWDDRVRNSILVDSGADLLLYGMGERTIVQAAKWLESGRPLRDARIPGTCTMSRAPIENYLTLPSQAEVTRDQTAYARAFQVQWNEQDPVRGRGLCQQHGARYLCQHKPAMPLSREELDATYVLPYARAWHPMYDALGGVPALEEVEFSITHVRGCFGACSFCALTFHQGRMVASRSRESVLAEARLLTQRPGFKGYIHDVGGPTANFRAPACKEQLRRGACAKRQCLFPTPCKRLNTDHREYIALLRELRQLPGVKKVFVRSGIRHDFLLADSDGAFLDELVKYHVSGQLKVAPEHVSPGVLRRMGKPGVAVYERFVEKYRRANLRAGMNQYLVPYFMSSHPGCTLEDAIELAQYLKRSGRRPEQVQDFYPTPGTLSTAMFHTGLDPRDMTPVYVPRTRREKDMQRALLQYDRPQNRALVVQALREAGRTDLIGYGPDCLIRPRPLANDRRKATNSESDGRSGRAPRTKSRPDAKGAARGGPRRKDAPRAVAQRPLNHGRPKKRNRR